MKKTRAPGVVLGSLLLAACAPLTFSHEGVIDFETYRSVHVSVTAPDVDTGYASNYLAEQLRMNSGFTTVTTDAAVAVDLNLTVSVSVAEQIEGDPEDIETNYAGTASYTARTPTGVDIDSGAEDDTSETPAEAVEDVLDEVAAHYMAPYRL